eukprot:CAMPEP_0178446240 /NCGR_PEP_ID=MMETSP0689_2-20121128/40687_1 /TAXON_ID=160604 /ORGANISM="Amphidinium massartii, Strain CS-259" /LENGTH=55 /DNA_ID=CAMNT_0020071029 /DNA_START=278 /DNA_END=441 /DNA_ORIENTATION=+
MSPTQDVETATKEATTCCMSGNAHWRKTRPSQRLQVASLQQGRARKGAISNGCIP